MGDKSTKNESVRKLTKVGRGTTMALTLPIRLVRDLGWRDGQKVTVKKIHGGLSIRDWRKK